MGPSVRTRHPITKLQVTNQYQYDLGYLPTWPSTIPRELNFGLRVLDWPIILVKITFQAHAFESRLLA